MYGLHIRLVLRNDTIRYNREMLPASGGTNRQGRAGYPHTIKMIQMFIIAYNMRLIKRLYFLDIHRASIGLDLQFV